MALLRNWIFFSMVHDDSYQVMEIAMSDKKPSSVLFLLLHCRKKRLHIPVVEMSFASSLVVSHYDCFSLLDDQLTSRTRKISQTTLWWQRSQQKCNSIQLLFFAPHLSHHIETHQINLPLFCRKPLYILRMRSVQSVGRKTISYCLVFIFCLLIINMFFWPILIGTYHL